MLREIMDVRKKLVELENLYKVMKNDSEFRREVDWVKIIKFES